MSGDEIRLGPFVGGLNTFSDPTAIDDLELAVCNNFDMYPDGSLVNRPPINDMGVSMTLGATGNMKLIGWFTSSSGATALIGSDGLTSTYYFNGTAWVLITATVAACAMAQYQDKAWLLAPPGSANPGGSWDLTAGFSAVALMPKGRTIAVQKERLWIGPGASVTSNGSRIYFSPLSTPATWAGDFISVSTGDGQNVLEIQVYFQDLLIFKNDSTYRFSYDVDPALGSVSRVSDTVGTFDTGCVATFENRIFVLHNSSMYELSNYNYERLNDKVPFEAVSTSTSLSEIASLSYFSNRLFVSFYDVLYVWAVRTRTWSTWSSSVAGLAAIGKVVPIPGAQDVNPQAYTFSRTPRAAKMFNIIDSIGTNVEPMVCSIQTKNYDFQTASRFKRLFKWGADVIARGTLIGTATPVQFSTTVSWGTLKTKTWGEVKTSPWGRLLGTTTERVDTVPISGLTGERKFVKLGDRSSRFRQIGFGVSIATNGDITTAPVNIFNLMTWVKDKQSVVKRIS